MMSEEQRVEAVALALAVQNGRAKGNCDCKRCRDAIYFEHDNARAAIASLQPLEDTEEGLREALVECRNKFAEYVELHSAKLLPERHPDEFYQQARTSHNAEVREKVARNQEMVELCDRALSAPPSPDSHSSTMRGEG